MGKEEVYIQCFRDHLMVSKLFTIIRRQRKHMGFTRFQKADNRFLYGFRCTSIHFSDQGKTRFSLCEGHNCLASTFTQNSINFPIPQALTLIDDLGTLLYASTIRQFATAIVTLPYRSRRFFFLQRK